MSKKKIVLVQDHQSADYWLHEAQRPFFNSAKFICLDPLAALILKHKVPALVTAAEYLCYDNDRVRKVGERAHYLSCTWFKDIDGLFATECRQRPEYIASREFNYAFLALFRAAVIIDNILNKETDCRFYIRDVPLRVKSSIRWDPLDSPAVHILKSLKSSGKIDLEVRQEARGGHEASNPVVPVKEPIDLNSLAWVMNKYKSPRGAVLYSGNPSLLEPLRGELSVLDNTLPYIRLFECSGVRALLSAFMPNEVPVVRKAAKKLSHDINLSAVRQKLLQSGMFQMEGLDLLPVIWPKIEAFYNHDWTIIKELITTLTETLKQLKPKALLVDEDVTRFNKALVLSAKSLGIKTGVVMHGLPGARVGYVPLEADVMYSWGDLPKNTLVEWGVSESKIYVTGCSKYDRLVRNNTPNSKKIKQLRKKAGFETDKPMVLVIPGAFRPNPLELLIEEECTSPEEIVRGIQYFVRMAREFPSVNILCKFRSGYPNDLYVEKMRLVEKELPPNMAWHIEGLALDWMEASDMIFNHFSSAALEAVLLSKPVVQMNFSGFPDIYPFIDLGVQSSVRSITQLREVFRQLSQREFDLEAMAAKQTNLLTPFIYAADGRSAKRVCQAFIKLLELSPDAH